ncbi:MAG: DMT family transporter [Deltaproteobacteria bacterium]|jgi:drug/metabolite transporter (DMT)-like permease|nr:DMT family transporter [Deltaproteobacteria bacterium]
MNNSKRFRVEKPIIDPVAGAYLGLIITMVVWGFVPVFLKKLLAVLTPIELSFTRFLLSGLALLLWVLLRQRPALGRILKQDTKLLLLCTLFGPLAAMVCFNFGILHVTIGTAAMFVAIEPLFTYLLAVLVGQEVWKANRLLSIMLALLGIVLVIFARETFGVTYWVSLLLVMLTPIIWAVNNIITKDIVKRHSPIVMTAVSFVLSSLFLAPALYPNYIQTVLHMGLTMWLALIYCILSTIFGFSIWYWSLRYLPPSTVAVSMYLIPVISVAAGRVFLKEPMPLMKAAGIAIVLLGLYLVNVRFK